MTNTYTNERPFKYKNILFDIITVISIFTLIFYNNNITQSIISAIKLCITSIIPSIFPFFVFADYLGTHHYDGKASNIIARIFGVSKVSCPAIICGLICGFPSGVKWAVKLYDNKIISKRELENLIGVVNVPSLAFVICGVGAGMLNNLYDGIALYVIVIISAILSARLSSLKEKKSEICRDICRQSFSITESIRNAGYASLTVSSYIIFFSVIINILSNIINSNKCIALISALLEIGNATYFITKSSFSNGIIQSALLGFSLGFSGLSVHLQAFSFLPSKISKKRYYIIKLTQGISCALLYVIYKSILY